MRTKAIILFSIITLAIACKSTKNSQSSNQNSGKEDIYRVIVSFASKGEGVPETNLASLESFLLTFGKAENKTIIYDKFHHGREGEVDYCFYLKELSSGKQKDFVKALKNLSTQLGQLVFIQENVACKHKK